MAAQGPTTATTPAVTTSRLTQMQMRFQQRQQQERDQRKVEMVSSTKTAITTSGASSGGGSSSSTIRSSATAIHSSVTTTSTNSASAIQQDLSASLGAGKVRQMFDERRHHKAAGIDKSYPLQPIGQVVKNGGGNANTVSPPSKMAAANGMNNKTRVPPISANTKARLARQQQENGNGEALGKSGGSATFDDNENLLEDEKFPDTISFDEDLTLTSTGTPLTRKLPNVGKLTTTAPHSNGTTPPQNVNSLKLKPVPGRTPTTTSLKASTPATGPKKTTSTVVPSTNPSSSPRGSQPSSAKSRASTAKSGTGMAASATVPGSRKASAASIASGSIASGMTNDSGPVPDGMARCTVCGRNFAEDRVTKHMEICRKTKSKKRKVFDVTKHRVQGTDAEKYVLRKGKTGASSSKKSISGPAVAAATSGGKGDWRRKHEEFIAAIRAAKEMKAYLAKGGKLSDLPPPPPSENPDYIQCPHCSRRFNQTAAERHIPKCATMLHNKPKPAAKGRRI